MIGIGSMPVNNSRRLVVTFCPNDIAHLTVEKLESYHGMIPEGPAGVEKYLNPSAKDHGNHGQVIPLPKFPLSDQTLRRKQS